MVRPLAVVAALTSATILGGCKKSPEEPPKPAATEAAASKPGATLLPLAVPAAAGDPEHGQFGLDKATAGLAGTGELEATIETTKGTLHCSLFADKAPVTVANFVGLARGTRPWKKKSTGAWVKEPFYDGLIFHRVIPGFVIQGGDPNGNGSGDAGYEFIDEVWQGAKHDRAGLLCMANRGANTNGSQFFVTDGPTPHLDGGYTIFGACKEADVVHAIASVPAMRERPTDAVTMTKVTIARR
jgi:peptidyl-prolyl cis-trans isomerase A (cyclophilin A)